MENQIWKTKAASEKTGKTFTEYWVSKQSFFHKISTQSDNWWKQQLSEWAERVEILWGFTKFYF